MCAEAVQSPPISLQRRGLGSTDLPCTMARARNEASPEELAKAIRANLRTLDTQDFACTEPSKVVDRHANLILDMLKLTPMPSAGLIASAAKVAFNTEPEEAKLFGQRLANAISFCRKKKRSMTTGKKLSAAVVSVIGALECKAQATHSVTLPTAKIGLHKLWRGISSPKKRILRAHQSISSEDPCKVERPKVRSRAQTTSKGSSSTAIREEILALYGATPRRAIQISSPGSEFEVEEEASPPKAHCPPEAHRRQYLDSGRRCMLRIFPDGTEEQATMSEGPNGFALARFRQEDPIETDMPNIMLTVVIPPPGEGTAVAKQAKKQQVQKKPAAVLCDEEEEGAESAVEEGCEAESVARSEAASPPTSRYGKMFYKKDCSYGIRQKDPPKKQIFAIRGLEQSKLEGIADSVIRRLEKGMPEATAREWAKAEVARQDSGI